ncbi:DeoR family transcriptional regulator [Clostridia bacterium]|nr:DeoR family transcriptional regulator [Clostridia bacterium]
MTKRQTQILQVVQEQKKIEVTLLSEMLEVSQVTIRKDLDILEEKGLLAREHGYAVLKERDDLGNRLALHYRKKLGIAKLASDMIDNGEVIMMESGSTCALLAEQLALYKKDVTIITNSVFIVSHIRENMMGKVILLGGEYQKESQVMVGPLVRKCAREFYVDKFFMGTDGLMPEIGFTCQDMIRAETMKQMAESAKQSIIITDSSKFEKRGVVLQARFECIRKVFTDEDISDIAKENLREHHISLHTVLGSMTTECASPKKENTNLN